MIAAVLVLCGTATTPAAADSVPAFWQQLAHCETGGRWDWGSGHRAGEGRTFVGGLGIYAANWDAWSAQVGVRGPAWSASPTDQVRVALWGWQHARAWWGCFSKVGTPHGVLLPAAQPDVAGLLDAMNAAAQSAQSLFRSP